MHLCVSETNSTGWKRDWKITTADYGFKEEKVGGAREVHSGRCGQRIHGISVFFLRLLRNLMYPIIKHGMKTTKKYTHCHMFQQPRALTATPGFFACSLPSVLGPYGTLDWVEGLEGKKRVSSCDSRHGRKCIHRSRQHSRGNRGSGDPKARPVPSLGHPLPTFSVAGGSALSSPPRAP